MTKLRALLLCFATLLVADAARAQGAPCASGTDIACTAQGAVRGLVEDGTLAFKNVPYAQAPVGPLRFRPPVPPTSWDGVRDGQKFGAICPQLIGGAVKGEED